MTGRLSEAASPTPDLVAGNTRLRARLRDVVTETQAEALTGTPLLVLADALRTIGVAPPTTDTRAGQPAETWRAELLGAVEARRNNLLRAAAAAYQGGARELVWALFDREDRADLVTLLRAAATNASSKDVLIAVHAVGRLGTAAVQDLVAGDADAIVPRLITGRLPDPDTAAVIARAWQRFTLHADVAELEATVAAAHAAATRARVAAMGRVAAPVARHLASQRDAVNLVTAVRLRAATPQNQGFLPTGQIARSQLRAVVAGRDVAAVVPVRWRAAVAAAESRGVEALARALDALIDAEARHPSWRTDPLGARVPVAYIAMVGHEARLLRRLVMLAPPADIRARRSAA